MNHLLDDDDDLNPKQERELTLSTGAILGIFLGLVLICGLFFAFGYNLGSKTKNPTTVAAETDSSSAPSVATSGRAKPSAGSLTTASSVEARPTVVATTTVPGAQPHVAQSEPAQQAAPEPAPAPVTRAATPAAAPAPAASAAGIYVVQVAAVSHQEDAALLVNALKGRGYAVAARSEPNDRLIHIQVGPFDTKAEAAAMRDRLLADGYNAIVK